MQDSTSPAGTTPASYPLVSVLIPTYRYAQYLPEAIESVLRQDYPNLEIIISDDASPDDSAEVIRSYAARDPRIRAVCHTQNLGMVANWNWCLGQARGKYVKYLFGDDLLTTRQTISRFVELLESSPTASLAASARILVDQETKVIGLWNHIRTPGLTNGRRAILDCLFRNQNLIGEPSVVMFRRTDALRGFSPDLRQVVDMELWFQLLLTGDLVYTPDPLCAFRRHGAQQTVVNEEGRVGDVEMANLFAIFLHKPEVRRATNMSMFTYQLTLFRRAYNLRKAARRHPKFLAIAAQLETHIPLFWRGPCWCAYRLTRLAENIQRALHKRLFEKFAPPAHLELRRLSVD